MKETATATSPRSFSGVGISTGKASGHLRFFQRQIATSKTARKKDPSVSEEERLQAAISQVRRALSELEKRARVEIGVQEAEIFEIHGMLLDDGELIDAILERIARGSTAEEAVNASCEEICQTLLALGDPYLSARAADLRDVSSQLLRALSGETDGGETDGKDAYILVADDLSPSETVTLDKSRILGFVTFAGTPNSHTSILARAMGIPALVGVGEIDRSLDGAFALLDAADGRLTVSPTDAQRSDFERVCSRENEIAREHDRYLRSLINKPAVTRSGHKMMIYANVGESAEADSALDCGADGIGLLRSEFLYLSLDRYPTEEELFSAYREIAQKMQGKRLVIRTLDVGADKQIPYFNLPNEENPALGFRAVRICLARESVFKTQLRAILRASAVGTVSVMIPMIVSVDEVRRCRFLLRECMAELSREGVAYDSKIEFGMMIETPAAAIMCRELAAEVDFFSVGTNDLTQYVLAADRQNPLLAELAENNREPILRLIHEASLAIHERGGWIGICGEMAADLLLTQRFADMEIDELSVSVPYLLGVREKVIACK